MNTVYDGLIVTRVPVTNQNILTGNSSCWEDVQFLRSGADACISETEAAMCKDTEHSRSSQWRMESDPNWGDIC